MHQYYHKSDYHRANKNKRCRGRRSPELEAIEYDCGIDKSANDRAERNVSRDQKHEREHHDENNKLKTSEPLHSIYNKNVIPKIEKLVNEDVLHIKGLIEKIDAKFVLIDNKKIEKKEFRNLNRPEDI